MLFNDERINPPHRTNEAFTHGCAFEHIVTPICPLPSYQYPKWEHSILEA